MTMIGFLGVGHLAAALLEGLLAGGRPGGDFLLSPRGQGAALGARLAVPVAADNRDLVARCDIVILATRPRDAVDAVAGLPFREDQLLVSACAGLPLDQLRGAAAPARLCRIMPLTAASLGASPTALFPDEARLRSLLAPLGPVLPLAREADFETATVSAAVYGFAQALIARAATWQAAQGLDPATARRLSALTFVAAGRMVAESETPMERLLGELATPGGITERGLGVLEEAGAMAAWEAACAAVLAKLRGSG